MASSDNSKNPFPYTFDESSEAPYKFSHQSVNGMIKEGRGRGERGRERGEERGEGRGERGEGRGE